MDPNGSRWIPLDPGGFQWIPQGGKSDPGRSHRIPGSTWIQWGLWNPMDPSESVFPPLQQNSWFIPEPFTFNTLYNHFNEYLLLDFHVPINLK
jgi:hypothetical protein